MSRIPSKEESREMLKWLNRNRYLLNRYAHQFIAYNASGIIAHGEHLREVMQLAEESGENFLIYLVPGFTGMVILTSKLFLHGGESSRR